MTLENNPLVNTGELLDFSKIAPEHVEEAVKHLLGEAAKAVERVTAPETPATWDDIVTPLQSAVGRFSRAWHAVGHLMGVMDCEEWRKAYNAHLPEVTQFFIALSQNEALYGKYKQIAASEGFAKLDPIRQRVINHEIRDFVLSGAELDASGKEEMSRLGEEGAMLTQKFGENLLDATNAFTLDITDKAELAGIPEDVCKMYEEAAKSAGIEGWRITLQYPSYIPAMQYADNRELRAKLFEAFGTRASDLGPSERDNTPIIDRILAIRDREAALLGFANYAEVSLATKMAESPAEVIGFLRDMAAKAKPWARKDQKELQEFARENLGIDKLEPWDQAWACEKMRVAKYAFSEQEVKQYFTLPAVFKGLFAMVEKMFDIRITKDTAPVWHEDVQFFRISTPDGKLIARFYTDLYARSSKRGGAWMDNDTTHAIMPDGSERTPIAYLVCNFARPTDGKPSRLTHDDVTTLFHEFGHGLHHMLSRVAVEQVSGINGVEWDAVEMPSQFMENWAWNYEIIKTISCHADTGEVVPEELFAKMLAAKNFQSGLFCVRQLEFALFDMLIHAEYANGGKDFMATLKRVRDEVAVVPSAPFNRFPHSFGHIFAGGYAAGYYSYKWAEVLSADAFSAFEEEGLFNPAVGKRWQNEVLAVGGSRDAMESFVAFRGRKPSIDALMRHTGMQGSPE